MDSHEHEDPAPALPGLAGGLRAAYARPVEVPPQVEAAILAMPPRRARVRRWRIGGVAAAAAVVLIATVAVYRARTHPAAPALALRGDLDRSGRVDILDAFLLAKMVAGGPVATADGSFDVTWDGRTDAEDVGAIARAAVSLNGGAL